MLYYGCKDSVLEIKKAVVVVVLFLKHHGLCETLADSNYFYKNESITPFASTWFEMACASMLGSKVQLAPPMVNICGKA